MATYPECDTRLKVGFNPTMPHREAGIRTDPTSMAKTSEFVHNLKAMATGVETTYI